MQCMDGISLVLCMLLTATKSLSGQSLYRRSLTYPLLPPTTDPITELIPQITSLRPSAAGQQLPITILPEDSFVISCGVAFITFKTD